MKKLLKINKLYLAGILAVAIVGYLFIPTKLNELKITSAIGNKDYGYFCVISSTKMINKKSPGLVQIRSITLDVEKLWGNKKGFDGTYAIVFTNDLAKSLMIHTAREKFTKSLSKKKIPYCQVIE